MARQKWRMEVMKKPKHVTVDRVVNRYEIQRPVAIEMLREIAERCGGEFKIGRRGHPSRLQF
jgi:hypothetical protein